MTRHLLLRSCAGALIVFAFGGAAQGILAGVSGGLWEVAGHGAPVRLCLADPLALAAYEHRNESCTRTVIRGDGQSAVVNYSCSGGGFGSSEVSLITPRSIHIDTQGISDGEPYKYGFDAHRIGDCSHH